MRRFVIGVVALVTAAAGAWFGLTLLTAGALQGCATALMEGTLVEVQGTLGVQPDAAPAPEIVRWPPGYTVGVDGGRLGLWHLVRVVAHEGDRVSMGGGAGTDDVFQGCGPIAISPVFSPEPRQIPDAGPGGPQG